MTIVDKMTFVILYSLLTFISSYQVVLMFLYQKLLYMKKKISEHDALKGIDLMIEGLSQEERQRIFDWVSSKYNVVMNDGGKNGNPASGRGDVPPKNSTGISTNLSVKDFLAQKKPQDTYERIACLAFYLEKIKQLDGFKTAELTQANKEARLSNFSNATVFISHAVDRYHYLTRLGKGKKALSARGESLVNALPDRDKVTTVLAENPINKRGAKRNKKKK